MTEDLWRALSTVVRHELTCGAARRQIADRLGITLGEADALIIRLLALQFAAVDPDGFLVPSVAWRSLRRSA